MKHILVCCLILLSACTSLKIYSPNPAIEPPELRGGNGVKISGDLVGAHETKATDNATATPPDMAHPSTNTAFDFYPGATFAFLDQFEGGLQASPLHGNVALLMRWQPVGEGARKAEEGNVPLAFYLKGGTGESRGNEIGTGYASDFEGSIRENYVHTGFSTGYRPMRNLLVYGGAAFGQYWMRAEVDQKQSVYVGSTTGNGITAGGGVFANWKYVQCFVSGEVTRLAYSGASTRTDVYLHTGVSFTPGN
jgi:hypothetical protein